MLARQRTDLAVITFHVNDLEMIQQSLDSSSSIRLQAGHVSCSECISISREEFQVFHRLQFFCTASFLRIFQRF